MDNIVLRKLDFLTGKDFPVYDNKLPSRMIYLRDQVEGTISDSTFTPWRRLQQAYSYMHLFFSDIYRSPAASAAAYRQKTGVARPGDSGHNYGVSIDFDIDRIIKANNMDYSTVCKNLMAFGWTPYQGINTTGVFQRGKEDWHFNFIGDYADRPSNRAPGGVQINNWIKNNIKFDSDIKSIQSMLLKLKLYHGDIDGVQGPLLNDAIIKFKSAWYTKNILSLGINKTIDEQFIKMVNIVSCDVVNIEGNLVI